MTPRQLTVVNPCNGSRKHVNASKISVTEFCNIIDIYWKTLTVFLLRIRPSSRYFLSNKDVIVRRDSSELISEQYHKLCTEKWKQLSSSSSSLQLYLCQLPGM